MSVSTGKFHCSHFSPAKSLFQSLSMATINFNGSGKACSSDALCPPSFYLPAPRRWLTSLLSACGQRPRQRARGGGGITPTPQDPVSQPQRITGPGSVLETPGNEKASIRPALPKPREISGAGFRTPAFVKAPLGIPLGSGYGQQLHFLWVTA